jgi:hypothetical protein
MPTTQTTEKLASLIASDRVEGTSVYRLGGKRIGIIMRADARQKAGHDCFCGYELWRLPGHR